MLKGIVYIFDVGMMGLYDGILGMECEVVIKCFLMFFFVWFEVLKEGRM